MTDRLNLQELGQCVPFTSMSARTGGEGPATFQPRPLLGYLRFHHRHLLIIYFPQWIILNLIPLRLGVEAEVTRNDDKMGQDAKPLRTLAHFGQQQYPEKKRAKHINGDIHQVPLSHDPLVGGDPRVLNQRIDAVQLHDRSLCECPDGVVARKIERPHLSDVGSPSRRLDLCLGCVTRADISDAQDDLCGAERYQVLGCLKA